MKVRNALNKWFFFLENKKFDIWNEEFDKLITKQQ